MLPSLQTRIPYPYLGGLVLFIAVANIFAYFFHLYFYWWWLDIPMHLLSGLWVGMTTLVLYYRGKHPIPIGYSPWILFVGAVASALLVGFCWEVFELIVQMTTLDPHDIVDSLGDMFNDFLGGYLAGYIAYKKKLFHSV